ncbi:hypothetical protein BDA99DRAFT_58526 [Phascolomyces articulosus]|uniref:Uncharacterized protein n=1 Tax=Phascolomyces articulosus TaxID=60185 RepID=A0AAD5PDV2_9FUNG|nr:hypothetical protein BDA99DRAFT_58526 [Phascolomyces articulosus]
MTRESRNYYNGGHNSGGLGDALSHLVEAGKNVALSKANTALAAAVNEANTALAKATDPSRSNTHIRGVGFSFNTPQRSHSDSNIYHQHQQAASTITPISASVRPTPPTPSSNSRQHHHHQHTRNNNPNTPVDRNRPLPTPPQHSASTSSINPFDPVVSPNDELPPPSYEAHFHDRRVELHDVDRIMQSTAQVSRST